MSRIYFKPFTFKKGISFVFLGLSCFIFNNNAYSETPPKIIGHYYVAKDNTNTRYNDLIQWEVTSYAEWSTFLNNLQTMPKDSEKDNPMALKQPEVIHFSVTNPDQKSGHDIFLSQAGVQQFSRMPIDVFYANNQPFREFLEGELSMHAGYDTTKGNIDINTPGIVVIFRGSTQLKNPSWVISLSDTDSMQRYKNFIYKLQPGTSTEINTLKSNGALFDDENTFLIYLNYPNPPQQILVVASNSLVRGTKVEPRYFYYKDLLGYFAMFKRQAEDNLAAAREVEQRPEENRRKQARSGALF